ncbi:MAG TPA: cytochrome P450 [Phycisphaerae bacterium]|nr:cytochrome P450 [Phycisphaerae bacterium]
MSAQHADVLFNPLLPDYRNDPYPTLRRLRTEDPVHHSPMLDVWVLTRYADVLAALRDPHLSASVKNWRGYERFYLRPGIAADNLLYEMYGRWMLQIDPPDHTRLRNLVNKAFTPAAVEHIRGQIAQTIDALLDAALANGATRFDAIAQFAYPLPLIVINQIMGIPREDAEKVKAWSAALLPSFSPALSIDALTRVNTALAEFREYFRTLVERRRNDPGPDLLSALIQARDQGDRLDDDELHATAILLAFAGHASTVQALGNLVLHLADPAQIALLREQPKLITAAVEESLRHQSPLQLIYRTTTQPFTAGEKTIPANELLFLSLPAANRDPERFPDPDRFDIQRPDNRHIAFGYGGHFCAGAALARLELALVAAAFLKRFRAWRPDGPIPPRDANILFRGFRSLPLAVEPP